jgi:hypothetical protein
MSNPDDPALRGRRRARSARRPPWLVPAAVGVLSGAAAVLPSSCADDAPPDEPAAPRTFLEPPLHDAEAGEELRMVRGREEWLWRVVSTTDEDVSVDFFVRVDGQLDERRTEHLRWPRNGFGLPEGFTLREARPDRIDVGGRARDCWRLRAHSREGVRLYWISAELPVAGFLRIAVEDRGKPLLQTAADAVLE